MKERMRKLIAKEWCSQLTANSKKRYEMRLTRALQNTGYNIIDYTMEWAVTPQGRSYWQNLNSTFGYNI
jgi:hypothetical protein